MQPYAALTLNRDRLLCPGDTPNSPKGSRDTAANLLFHYPFLGRYDLGYCSIPSVQYIIPN